jgi:HlyD family secretion protein
MAGFDNISPVMTDRLSQDLNSLRIEQHKRAGEGRGRKQMVLGLVALVTLGIAAVIAFVPVGTSLKDLRGKTREVGVALVARQSPSADSVVLTAGGYIIPHRRIEVSSKISGRVERLLVEKGDVVRSGQVLACLDDREIRAQLEQARATKVAAEARLKEALTGSRPQEIQRATAALEEAEATAKTTSYSLDRARRLHTGGVLAQQDLDNAQNAHDVAVAQAKVAKENLELARIGPRQEQIDLARAQLAESDAAVRWLEAQLENTVIRAPADGTVLERLIEQGEMVTTGYVSGRGAKSAFCSIANLKDLEVELDINESDIPRVRLGQGCVVSPDSYPDRKYKARVREIAPEANRQKATIQVKVAIDAPDEYLRPETNAKVNFLEEERNPAGAKEGRILIPKAAIVGSGSGSDVFLLKDGRAARQSIEAGRELQGQVEVRSGLTGGEQLIVRGLEGLKDGDKVATRQ